MRIQINQQEIELAIKAYVSTQGFSLVGKAVTIELKAGRGADGFTADLDITTDINEIPDGPVKRNPTASTLDLQGNDTLAKTDSAKRQTKKSKPAEPAAITPDESFLKEIKDVPEEVEPSKAEVAIEHSETVPDTNDEAPAPTTAESSIFSRKK